MVTNPDINPVQQGLTSVNRRELVFPFGDSHTLFRSIEAKVRHPMGPSTIYDKVFQGAGGMIEVEAVSNTPRNIKQVKNARAKPKRRFAPQISTSPTMWQLNLLHMFS